MKNKSIRFHLGLMFVVKVLTACILFFLQPIFCISQAKKAPLELTIEGKKLIIEALIPNGITEFEMRIESSRNNKISRFTDISINNLEKERFETRFRNMAEDFWYPIVDIQIEPGMEGICIFNDGANGQIFTGTPYYREPEPLKREVVIPPNKLEPWENSLFVIPRKGNELKQFYIRNKYPVILREFRHEVNLLSTDWSGKVELYAKINDVVKLIASDSVISIAENKANLELEVFKNKGISKERLLLALEAAVHEGMARQVTDPRSLMFGSFNTFYDLEARTYRTPYWTWGGSHLVKMVLDAMEIPELKHRLDSTSLINSLKNTGNLYLKYQVKEENHPARGSFLVIWTSRGSLPFGYKKWIGTSDSGILLRWALLPLFKATGDSAYLKSATFWIQENERLLREHAVVPHKYLYDEDQFSPDILDETGWDTEGHAALYELTGIDAYRQIGKKYMDHRMENFGREDGLWQRNYNIETGKVSETEFMTRGLGWAMEGLLAMNRMYPNSKYLEYAKKMADHLIRWQLPSGAWSYIFNQAPEKFGITEKGTALWSLLFYQLYEATGNKKYLDVARKALNWCLDNQYTGPDPQAYGGIFGRTSASAVGYRHYYDISCAYTTGFFGLAVMEELKILNEKL